MFEFGGTSVSSRAGFVSARCWRLQQVVLAVLLSIFQSIGGQEWKCAHCAPGEAFSDFLLPPGNAGDVVEGGWKSDIHNLWSTHVEVVSLTSDNGGPLPPSFHKRIAAEIIGGWNDFRHNIAPKLRKGHPLREFLGQSHAGALNDGFFHYQKRLFEASGDLKMALSEQDQHGNPTPHPDANSSWPVMQELFEYRQLRRMVDRLSRRYLARSGMKPDVAKALNYSIFNWAAVHGPGEFHGPHTHVGEYHVAVFYAQNGPSGGRLRLADPRGHSPPFGRTHYHTPKAGDLVIFPSWLSHMATVTSPQSHGESEADPYRAVISFNVGPVQGPLPCHLWWSDPTGDVSFHRKSKVDTDAWGLSAFV